ncbi:hypothetical protein HHX47_DHR4000220 [Lentinula edodes]|nr:hypothetical protein HHX47_DHR4000220 [Lentinula edodes]
MLGLRKRSGRISDILELLSEFCDCLPFTLPEILDLAMGFHTWVHWFETLTKFLQERIPISSERGFFCTEM